MRDHGHDFAMGVEAQRARSPKSPDVAIISSIVACKSFASSTADHDLVLVTELEKHRAEVGESSRSASETV